MYLRSVEFPKRSLCTFHPHHDRYRTPFNRSRRIQIQMPLLAGKSDATFFERVQWSRPFSVRSLELLVSSLAQGRSSLAAGLAHCVLIRQQGNVASLSAASCGVFTGAGAFEGAFRTGFWWCDE
jgi:hypothetical protein